MITKFDYALAGLIGFFAGMFLIPVLLRVQIRDPAVLLATPWVIAAVVLFGVWIGEQLARIKPIFSQLAKFATVGILNTSIDFGILNLLSIATGITKGFVIGGVNVPGVALAITNAYFWNKFWVFSAKDNKGALHDFPKFILVSGSGILLNSGIVIFITSYTGPGFGLEEGIALNVAKVIATPLSMTWNFLGYKFVVFRSTKTPSPNPQL